MANETLMAHIEAARAELLVVQNLKPEDRDLVGKLMTEVVAHLTEAELDTKDVKKTAEENLGEQLKQQVRSLEASHPKLASMLDRLSNMLSSLGI